MTYRGGCHCGRNTFEVEGDLKQVMDCNCSICTMRGYLHWAVPPENLRLVTPEANLAAYTFKSGTVKHHSLLPQLRMRAICLRARRRVRQRTLHRRRRAIGPEDRAIRRPQSLAARA
jgi:hypothetical protein